MLANVWQAFNNLIPYQRVLVATVTAVNGDGTSSVITLDGQTLRPIGTSVSAGSRAFVQNNQIIGEAPTLDNVDQTV